MTIKELAQILKQYPDDAKVYVACYGEHNIDCDDSEDVTCAITDEPTGSLILCDVGTADFIERHGVTR